MNVLATQITADGTDGVGSVTSLGSSPVASATVGLSPTLPIGLDPPPPAGLNPTLPIGLDPPPPAGLSPTLPIGEQGGGASVSTNPEATQKLSPTLPLGPDAGNEAPVNASVTAATLEVRIPSTPSLAFPLHPLEIDPPNSAVLVP